MSTQFLFSAFCVCAYVVHASEYKLIFSDEFTGKQLNTSVWTNHMPPCHSYPYEMQYYLPKNVYLENGNLVLKTIYDPTTENGIKYPYTSGAVTSSGKFSATYGKWEVRAKLPTPKFKQAWPAIWFQYQSGGCYQEVDLMEQWVGYWNNDVFTSYYWNPENAKPSCGTPYGAHVDRYPPSGVIDFSADFHIWTMEWNKTAVAFSLDGKPRAVLNSASCNGCTLPYEPAYVILNTAVCGAGWCGGPDDVPTDVTGYFYIDYVRVYELTN